MVQTILLYNVEIWHVHVSNSFDGLKPLTATALGTFFGAAVATTSYTRPFGSVVSILRIFFKVTYTGLGTPLNDP